LGDVTYPLGEYPPHLAALLTSTIEFVKELADVVRDLDGGSTFASSVEAWRMEDLLLSDNFCSSCIFRISSSILEPMLMRSALSSNLSTF